jgi:NitT/TauT family transport system substrate-binding protein
MANYQTGGSPFELATNTSFWNRNMRIQKSRQLGGNGMNNGNRRIALLSALALCLTILTGTVAKAADSIPTVKIMVGGLNKQIYLPAKLSEVLGNFKKYGLNVQLTDEPSGVEAETAMLSGEIDLVLGFYDHNIDLQTKGKSTIDVATLLQAPGEVELCRTDLKDTFKSPADWKNGVNAGVTGLGSSTNFLTKALATHAGVPLSQVHSLAVGAGNTFIAAMQQKAIDCGMTTEPTISRVLSSGLGYVLVDMRYGNLTHAALGGPYVATCVYGRSDWVKANSATVQKVVNAFYDTMQFIKKHTALQIAQQMPVDYYSAIGIDAYAKALDDEKAMYNPSGRMVAGAPANILRVLASGNGYSKSVQSGVNLSATYTNAYVQEAVSQVARTNAVLAAKAKKKK